MYPIKNNSLFKKKMCIKIVFLIYIYLVELHIFFNNIKTEDVIIEFFLHKHN